MQQQVLGIVGASGSGKTTFLKKHYRFIISGRRPDCL
jgi:uridine kinase